MSWLRRIPGFSKRNRIRNEAILWHLEQEYTVMDKIRQRRLTCFGHVTRMGRGRLPTRTMRCHLINGPEETEKDSQRPG